MTVVILVVVAYLYGVGSPPQVDVRQAPDLQTCEAIAPRVKQRLLASPEVRDAKVTCLVVQAPPPGDKS